MPRRAATIVGVLLFAACSTQRAQVTPHDPGAPQKPPHAFPLPQNESPFAPAFTRFKESVGKLDTYALADPVRCQSCHADVVAQWDPSAHHNASFGNRFYVAGVALTREHRGNKAGRLCAACHDTTLLLDGTFDRDDVAKSPRANDGLGCLVCHSITEASRVGNGGYLLDYRTFSEPDPKNAASVADHKKAMKAPVMSSAEFCASCHKVSLGAEVNGKRWYRGQNDFDGWEQGPYALGGAKTAGFIYAPEVQPTLCQDCHMPQEPAVKGDLAAKAHGGTEKTIRSHRFLGANTAVPTFNDDADAVGRQKKHLEGVVRVDVIAVRKIPSKAEPAETVTIAPGDRFALDVVVENTRVGHRFPTGTADSNEVWLSLEVRDAKGKLVARHGVLDDKGALGPESHRFGVLQLDNDGKPALAREAHRFAAAGWDTTIAPHDAKVIRFAMSAPKGVALPLTVTAKVLYRKFSRSFTELACATKAASAPPLSPCPKLPIVEVGRDDVTLGSGTVTSKPPRWQRLDAYARGLLNSLQEDVGDAGPVLAEVISLAPKNAEGFIDMARLFIRQGRTQDAMAELDLATSIDALTPVIPFLRGVAHYEIYKLGEAVEPLQLALARAPKSLHGAELLAEALQLKGDDVGAIAIAQLGLAIDPEAAQLHHLEALSFDHLGMPKDAEIAREGYLKFRRDDDTPKLRTICKNIVPGCARLANPLPTHDVEWLAK